MAENGHLLGFRRSFFKNNIKLINNYSKLNKKGIDFLSWGTQASYCTAKTCTSGKKLDPKVNIIHIFTCNSTCMISLIFKPT